MAVARPMPDEAPVTRMVFPANENGLYDMFLISFVWFYFYQI